MSRWCVSATADVFAVSWWVSVTSVVIVVLVFLVVPREHPLVEGAMRLSGFTCEPCK